MESDLINTDTGSHLNQREQAYHAFTRKLLARDLVPGQFISQRMLVALTGFTLAAIRELIPRLEAEGLIRTVPQRGMQVAQADLSLAREAFQFRVFLEREAVALYARNAADEELRNLRREHLDILERVRDPSDARLLADAQALDWRFHDRIIDALGNSIISNAYRVNSIKIRLIRGDRTRIDGYVEPSMLSHLAILDALEARDESRAQALLAEHIEGARRRALDV